MASDLAEAALRYASAGWHVLPLVPRAKTPRTRHGLLEANNQESVVQAWWDHWPDANIGLRTGKIFDVLDIDGPTGIESLRQFTYSHDGPSTTTGKGYHLLFKVTGARNGAGMLPGLDFRGHNGYIVAPPSIHPLGHRYQWRTDPELPLPDAPQWLLDMLDRTKPRSGGNPILVSPEAASMKMRYWLYLFERFQWRATQVGGRLTMSCPLGKHSDTSPSFNIYPDGTWHCFGCQSHGRSGEDAERQLQR